MPVENKKRLSGTLLQKELEASCRDLNYISETDSPVEPVLGSRFRGSSLRDFVSKAVPGDEGPIAEGRAAQFFERLTADRAWHTGEERKAVQRYRELEKLMTEHLNDLAIFRVGRVRVEIFVLGRDSEGNVAGIRTSAVET